MDLLSVENLDVRYGQLRAVRGVSMSVAKGEVIALIGANGAGKTTFLRAVAGAVPVAGGRVSLAGRDMTRLPAQARVAAGLALVPEGRKLFADMTVEENLALGATVNRPANWTIERVLATFPNLVKRRNARCGHLSGGEQQATAIGRALMSNPDILILDEVSLGLSPLVILSTFGLAIVLDNVMFQIFGANARSLSQFVGDLAFAAYELPGGVFVGKLPVWVLLTAIVVLGGLHLMLTRTPLGRRIRATSIDPVTTGLAGVNARQSAAIAAAIAMMMVAISGVALGFRTVFDAYAGGPQLLFAFEATIIGGARSMWGVFIGAMVLAFAQTGAAMFHPQAFLLGSHLMFLGVLFARLGLGSGNLATRMRQVVGRA